MTEKDTGCQNCRIFCENNRNRNYEPGKAGTNGIYAYQKHEQWQ